jgi:MFS family permease
MFAFLIGLFLFALDNTIVADVQPAIVNDFQSVDKISWLATGFFMATVGTSSPIIRPLKSLFENSSDDSDGVAVRSNVHDISCEMVLYCDGCVI